MPKLKPRPQKPLDFHYKFNFPDGKSAEFKVRLHGDTLALEHEQRAEYPEWTKLSVHQCANCPLQEAECPHCPVAQKLTDVIEFFKDQLSSDTALIEITAGPRTYKKDAAVAIGVSAIVGLCMATAGCPILDKLKPLAQTHMPFPTHRESVYRHIANYLLGQYLRARKGKKPDWEMKGFGKLMDDVRTVNQSFCKRLHTVCSQDANLNALVHLDCFADNASLLVQLSALDNLERAFHGIIDDDSFLEG